jgi:hypothetical protein
VSAKAGAMAVIGQRRWPLSVKLLLAVGVLFILQAIPFTGVFLMIVGGPFWSIPLITLAVVVAGIEGLFGRAPRWFVLVPLCWFGAYALLVVREDAALQRLQAEIEQKNAAAPRIPFDPARHDLLVYGHAIEWLLDRRFPAVYTRKSIRDGTTEVSRLASGETCRQLAGAGGNRGAGDRAIRVLRVHPAMARRHGLEPDPQMCIVTHEEAPTRAIIEVERSRAKTKVASLPVRLTSVTVRGEGIESTIELATARPLRRFPMLALGCALNSSAPSWDCSWGFLRQRSIVLGAGTEAAAVAAALGPAGTGSLAPSSESSEDVRARATAAAERAAERRRAAFDELLSDPLSVTHKHPLIEELRQEPQRLVAVAEQLIGALEAAAAEEARNGGQQATKSATIFADLLAKLPDEALRQHGTRILALLDGPFRGWRRSASALTQRLDVFGPAAMPLLLARLKSDAGGSQISQPVHHAIIALCRMGRDAANEAAPVLLELWQWRNRPRKRILRDRSGERREVEEPPRLTRGDRTLYLTLLRLGLGERVSLPEAARNPDWWQTARQTTTPESPASVCK